MIRIYNLTPESNSKLFVDVTKESDKISVNSSVNEDGTEFKLEPEEVHHSVEDVSEQIENKSKSFVLSQNIDNLCVNVSGGFYYP